MEARDIDGLIAKEIERHYENTDSPYYLAELGVFFREHNITIPDDIQFKDYLKIKFHQHLVVIQDEDIPARIAIAPPDKAAYVQSQLSRSLSDQLDDSEVDYSRLPFALVAAFCKIPLPGTRLYFRINPPFRYETRERMPDNHYVEIDDSFRPPSVAGKTVQDISYSDRHLIYEHIKKWAEAKAIDLQTLYYDTSQKAITASGSVEQTETNALQRLVNAQEPEIRSRIRIPGDIASSLSRLP